jgi:two-component system, NtrC family, response regulator HydG
MHHEEHEAEDRMRRRSRELIHSLVAKSAAMKEFLSRINRFAKLDRAILLEGERGSGKSTFAELIHLESSRATGPFLSVNLASLSEGLICTELFGHVKGAYTSSTGVRPGLLRAASGGTILLDEIGKAPLEVQRSMLTVLDRKVVRPVGADREEPLDSRIILACSENPEELVSRGRMLPDFRDRIGLFRARVPSLRERGDDLAELVRQFLTQAAGQHTRNEGRVPFATPALLDRLAAYEWPGNVRELEQLCSRLASDADGTLALDDVLLVFDLSKYRGSTSQEAFGGQMPSKAQVLAAIAECGGNRTKAALRLGIGRTTLYRILDAGNDAPEGESLPA